MPGSVLSSESNAASSAPALSFIIPTYNRVDVLKLCLERLEGQSFADFEVIVVDDGSTDTTWAWLQQYQAATPLRLRCLHQANAGPARARNVAITQARAAICIIIGDDILCSPGFAAEHSRFHSGHPEPNFAALGLTRWSESLQEVTPFMRWMDDSGTQFAYEDLLAGAPPDWRYFYTSNLSLKTELLQRHPFSEEFPFANMEDMELGYRLQVKENLRIVFLPGATAEHVHPTDFRKACVRAQRTGLSLRVFDRLWPGQFSAPGGTLRRGLKGLLLANAWLLSPLSAVTARLTRVWCPNPLVAFTLAFHTELARRRGR